MDDVTLLSLYAEAQAALARIEERRRLSPVRRPWKIRCFITERQALAWLDTTSVEASAFTVDGRGSVGGAAYDLTHWRQAVGAPVTLGTLRADSIGLLDWLGVHDAPAPAGPWATPGLPLADVRQRVAQWQAEAATLPPSPPLLHGARLALAWRRRAPIGRGDAVASFLIGDRHGPGRWDASFGGLVALGFRASGAAWKIADPAQFDRLWLRAIALGACDHLDQEVRLRAYAERAAAHIASRRRPGRLKDVLMMAMSRPFITSRLVADQLNLTSAGAIKLLGIATDAGLLLERSGQSSYRSYIIPVSHAPHASTAPDPLIDPQITDFWSEA
ncbi:hypothetical protein [Sphingobium cupriresistens]|uniref:HTH DNA binding domain-containing protein n=1 Tax=Sphingobium cupriresistens LL01 TaxID=1420583 RepID=A0A0J7XKL9_9SPHN|nr:hypothetical protein [Sphingobium cupriresistens]KMS52214.1 hypothetical protein V473_22105 [Sphingobium cupriresistens LL01]